MKEKQLEAKCRTAAHKKGHLLLKWTCPGNKGVPDRILIRKSPELVRKNKVIRQQHIAFIEFKVPGNKPTKIQEYWHQNLRDMGCEVHVIDDYEKFLELI